MKAHKQKSSGKFFRDFVIIDNREYPVKLGKTVASSLTGFVIGAAAAHIVWFSTVKQIFDVLGLN